MMVRAGDVVATVCGNQANVAMMQHRHDQALALAERSVELQEESGTPHGLGIALASLGQISVRLGNLRRAEQALNRALDVRSPLQFMRETTGAVFDTLAQIHLVRGNHEDASRACSDRARPTATRTAGISGRCRRSRRALALRRGDAAQALAIATQIARADDVPAAYATQAELIAVEALLASGRRDEAEQRLTAASGLMPAAGMSSVWGEFLRLRGRVHARGRTRDRGVSRPRPERQRVRAARREVPGRPQLSRARQAGRPPRARARARRATCRRARDLRVARRAARISRRRAPRSPAMPTAATGAFLGSPVDGDAALVRRIVDAAVTPALLAKEGTTTLLEACDAQAAVIFTQPRPGDVARRRGRRLRRRDGALDGGARRRDRPAAAARRCWSVDAIGRDGSAPRAAPRSRRCGRSRRRRCSASARSARCCARDSSCARRASGRPSRRRASIERSLEPLHSRASSAPAPRCSASPI